jgi:hypothetical protein
MRSGRNGKSYLQSGLKRVAEQIEIEIELSPHPNASSGKTPTFHNENSVEFVKWCPVPSPFKFVSS